MQSLEGGRNNAKFMPSKIQRGKKLPSAVRVVHNACYGFTATRMINVLGFGMQARTSAISLSLDVVSTKKQRVARW